MMSAQQISYDFRITYELIEVTPPKLLGPLIQLAKELDKYTNHLEMSYQQLADKFGTSKNTAIKYINQLEEVGLIQVQRLHLPGQKFALMNRYALSGVAHCLLWQAKKCADQNHSQAQKMDFPAQNVDSLSLKKEEEELDSNHSTSNLLEDGTSKRTSKSNDAAGKNAETTKTETAYPDVVLEVLNVEQIESQLKTNSLERIIEACEYAMSRDDISSKAGYAWKILSKSDPIPKAKKRKAKRSIDGSISSKEDFFSGKYGKHLKWWMERTPEERYQTGSYLFEMSPERQAELHARCERINKVRAAKRKAFYAGDYGEKVREICKQAFTETSKGYWMLEQLEAYADPDDAETLIVRVRDDNVRMLMNMVRGRIMEGLPEFKDVVFHINRLTHLEPLSVDKFANMREEIRRDLEKKELGEVAENSA